MIRPTRTGEDGPPDAGRNPVTASQTPVALLPAPSDGTPRTFGALGSPVRRRILDSLTREKTIPDLAAELNLRPSTIRYHLSILVGQQLVEEVFVPRRGGRGRPAIAYRAVVRSAVSGYPPRHFELLASVALGTLVEVVGQEEAVRILSAKGVQVGQGLVHAAADRGGVRAWTPDAVETHLLKGVFREFGIQTEVSSQGPTHLEYLTRTCPFLELAERMPSLICDALDQGFHDGMDQALGVRTERRRCMGHGDSACEYRMTWAATMPEENLRVSNG